MPQGIVARWAVTVVAVVGVSATARHVGAATAYALTTANTIAVFDTSTPGTILRTFPVSDLSSDEILAIDLPSTGDPVSAGYLLGLGSSGCFYSIDLRTGRAFRSSTCITP